MSNRKSNIHSVGSGIYLHKNKNIVFFFKFHPIVSVEESIVDALRITDQLFKSSVLHEWCFHNRLCSAYYKVKF
jgi:hypothetical protein